jgi:DNA gyrase subunit A
LAGKKKNKNQNQMRLEDLEVAPAIIHNERITDTLETNYMPYAMSVIVSRAIPEIDGFKPAHRKLLYTMYKMGLLKGPRTKSANIVGQTMKLNPHGDQTIYETMVRLTRGNGALLHPYIDSKGNMGKQYSRDMQYAAPRYTEAKLDAFSEELFRSIDQEVVDFVPNYDGTLEEPTLLPTSFPAVLVNANQGIAVSMASNISPFNLEEVCSATINYIKNPASDPMTVMPAPDFPGGGQLIYNLDDMRAIYETGRGSFKLRAKYRIDKKNSLVEIYEIPYSTTVEAIIDSIVDQVKSGKLKDINDVRDETDLQGLKITLDCKRSTDYELLIQRLFQLTPMESSFSCNFNILINGTPRVMGVKSIIAEWLVFRRTTVRRGKIFELGQKTDRLHLLKALEKILLDIDRAIKIIRETDEERLVIPNLCEAFDIDTDQAEFVAEIKLRNLNREYILKRLKDVKGLEDEIAETKKILENPDLLDQLIIDDLERIIERYGQDRKTELIDEKDIKEVDHTDFIDDFNLKVFLTKHGYLKKLALTSLRSAGDLKTKESDYIIQEIEGTNKNLLFVFTSLAQCYRIPLYDLEDNKPSDWGNYLPNVLDFDKDEEPVFIVLQTIGEDEKEEDRYQGEILVGFDSGRVSRIDLNSYVTKTRRRKLKNAFFTNEAPVGGVYLPPLEEGQEEADVFLLNDQDQLVLFNASLIEQVNNRSNRGQKVQKLKRKSKSVYFGPADKLKLEDPEYYRIRTLDQNGRYLRENDKDAIQENI